MRHTIFIDDMPLRTVIGVRPRERLEAQELLVSVELDAELPTRGWRDELGDTVDYSELAGRIARAVEGSSFNLVESLARRVAELCLADPRVLAATVEIRKPAALPGGGIPGVRVALRRGETPKE